MDAIRKIEEALAAGPTEGEWSVPHYSRDDVSCNCTSVLSETYCGAIAEIFFNDGRSVAEGGGDDPIPSEAKANGMLIAACCPANIREVLQTLASKEAELAAREAEIANQALNYVSLFGELQNAMAEIERVRSLTDAQIDDLWIRRDCIEAIQAGDICAQVRCVVRAALTQQPTKD